MTVQVGPWSKGLRLHHELSLAELKALLHGQGLHHEALAWPLLTLDAAALDHNIATAAQAFLQRDVWHAPHIKTHMSEAIWAQQDAAGAWGATVATPTQWRTARHWGTSRLVLANELVDPREAAQWRTEAEHSRQGGAPSLTTLVSVDSLLGVDTLAQAFSGASPAVRQCVNIVVEVGVPGGRTGVRSISEGLALAQAARRAGLAVVGVSGYEGSVTSEATPADLAAVAQWLTSIRSLGDHLLAAGLISPLDTLGAPDRQVLFSAGGSSFVDVVLEALAAPLTSGAIPQVLVRSGAYAIGDHGFYQRMDPWSRMGVDPIRPAATVWGQVLSTAEPGLVHLGVGRRDLGDDLDLPIALGYRAMSRPASGGTPIVLGPLQPLCDVQVTGLNDQHLHLRGRVHDLSVGDVVALGFSHPCTTIDRWRTALVLRDGVISDVISFEFS